MDVGSVILATHNRMRPSIVLILILIFSCDKKQQQYITNSEIKDDHQIIQEINVANDTTQLKEFFVDSLNIGRKTFSKVEISNYETEDSNFVNIKFYSKQNYKWKLIQTVHFLKDGITVCDPKIIDFNNDSLNDLTIISSEAARGANEIRRLFIFDKTIDKFIFVKNSEDFPNIRYNKDLNCIDAFLVYAGCKTVFLKLSGNTLKEIASVELFNGLSVMIFDKKGKETIIFQDTTVEDEYLRYKNFDPLEVYIEQ